MVCEIFAAKARKSVKFDARGIR